MGDPRNVFPYSVPYATVYDPRPDGLIEEHLIRMSPHTYRTQGFRDGKLSYTGDVSEDDVLRSELWSTSELVDQEERVDSTCPAAVLNYIVPEQRDQLLYNKLWGRILKKVDKMFLEESSIIPSNFRITPCDRTEMEIRQGYHHEPPRFWRPIVIPSHYLKPGNFVMISYKSAPGSDD